MTGIHHERLLVCHLAEVFHHEAILCPVLEHGTIASVCYQFVRMLCHCRVKVVLNHQHDGGSLLRAVWIVAYRTGIHLVVRTVAIHVYSAVFVKFFEELRCEFRMKMFREIAQRIAQGEFLLFVGENLLALGRMVYLFIVCLRFRQSVGDSDAYLLLELFFCHSCFDLDIFI